MPKTKKEYNDADRKAVEKNFCAKKILQEHFKYNPNKAAKRNPVPDKRFKRKNAADNVMKQALAAWGDSSSEPEKETDADDKDALNIELGKAEQTRDDLIVCVVDLKETIDDLENEKKVLTEKITSVEHERDDLVVVVVDLKETIENLSKEKDALVEKVTDVEQERDDLLIVIVDLRETIEELGAECRPGNSDKGKEVASEAHIKLENELNAVRTSLCAELEKNRQLQAELERVKNDLEKSLKWT
ncbi:PREDICTED: myosin-2 heavy chain-like [Nicotiana attenuata]|uniref:myosin-2 heavy chain-like n=1 Tax=Nicotiana attenuata TaxID=49451 RepID=UPI00090502F8|nr:PREDICTED: myosin-2 heavy chain-like [Nicotiana attenuata]